MRRAVAIISLLCCFAAAAPAQVTVDFPPATGKPPPAAKAPKKTVSGGFATAPIPGPGPTMRITEHRLPPPPTNVTIMYKLEYGRQLRYVHADGTVQTFDQWRSFPGDGYGIVSKANKALAESLNYQYATKPLAEGGFDPHDVPLLYMTGDYAFTFTEQEVENLRRFLMDGGTILFNAARGREAFTRAVAMEMRRVFPNKPFMRMPPDHPVFNARYRIPRVTVMADGARFTQAPEVYSIDIGTRAAAILLPWGAGAAWSDAGEYHPRGRHMVDELADRLGVNLIAYVLGSTEYARFLAQKFAVYSGQDPAEGDPLRFAIARYRGSFDLYPAVQNSVLSAIRRNLDVAVDYSPAYVDLDAPALHYYPLAFMTGHYDFQLTDPQVANLRSYLTRGGVLLASAGAGLSPFDMAFRREMQRVLPDAPLVQLPPTHPIFLSGPIRIDHVKYTEPVIRDDPTLDQPVIFGQFVNDQLAVIYTPYDLMTGVNREPNAYAKAYAPRDADKLLIDLIAWCLTH